MFTNFQCLVLKAVFYFVLIYMALTGFSCRQQDLTRSFTVLEIGFIPVSHERGCLFLRSGAYVYDVDAQSICRALHGAAKVQKVNVLIFYYFEAPSGAIKLQCKQTCVSPWQELAV